MTIACLISRLVSIPIPRIDKLLDRLFKSKFSTKHGPFTWAPLVAEKHEGRIHFLIRYRMFEWLVIFYGITNAPEFNEQYLL